MANVSQIPSAKLYEASASNLGIAAGVSLAGGFRAASEIKVHDDMAKKAVTTSKDMALALIGYKHPIVGLVAGAVSPLVGLLIDHYMEVRNHTKMVSKLQAHLEMGTLGAEPMDSVPKAFWAKDARTLFYKWINTALHSNGIR